MSKSIKIGKAFFAIAALAVLATSLAAASGTPLPATQKLTCSFGSINTSNWIYINAIIILLTLTVSGAIYAFSKMLPQKEASKIKGYIKYEYVQCIISIAIIVVLIIFQSVACNYSAGITGADPFTSAQVYVGSLLFVNGTSIITQLYSASVQTTINGQIISGLAGGSLGLGLSKLNTNYGGTWLPPGTAGNPTGAPLYLKGPLDIKIEPSANFPLLFKNYGDMLLDLYAPLVIATFGMLFLQYITLPMIATLCLSVVVPLALLIRSFGFVGPRLKEAADSFLAIAIAFYFVYPMTFVMDQQIIAWVFCSPNVPTCNPYYSSYGIPYTLNSISESSLFSSNTAYVSNYFSGTTSANFNIPLSFYGSIISELGTTNNGTTIFAPFNLVFSDGSLIAQYMFKGVVLVALDLALTIGFGLGLMKAINSGLAFINEGGIW